jgi:hypothetical protein
MSISINGVGRVTSATSDTRTTDSNVPAVDPAVSDIATPQIDGVTNQPVPPRFPWLSRLALELEATAQQKPTFPSAPQIGDNLDQAA